jgi:uncharacterized protein YndB with AHSA1/START domain
MTTPSQVNAERMIAAPPVAIFDVLTDPAKHSVIDGSGTVRGTNGEPARLVLGSTFGMSMRNRISYRTKPKVVEFEADRRIAWRNKGGPIWRYELFPEGSGTRVVETYDLTAARGASLLKRTRLPARTQQSMARTLERLDRFVTTGRPDTAH